MSGTLAEAWDLGRRLDDAMNQSADRALVLAGPAPAPLCTCGARSEKRGGRQHRRGCPMRGHTRSWWADKREFPS